MVGLAQPAMPRSSRGTQYSAPFVMPAPIGGLNTKDPLAAMDISYASYLENIWPMQAEVEVRKGYKSLIETKLPFDITELMTYNSSIIGSSIGAMFGVSGGHIYDLTNPSSPVSVYSGLSGAKFDETLFSTEGGDYLVALSGADPLMLYDGLSWQPVTGTSTPLAITGVDTATLIQSTNYRERLWFTQKGTMNLWYLPSGTIAGAVKQFDMSSVFTRGGSIAFTAVWTAETGNNLGSMFVVMTTEGEIAIYQGSNPDEAEDFGMVARFYLAAPIEACHCEYGTDLLILTESGIFSLTKVMRNATINLSTNEVGIADVYAPAVLTDKITPNILRVVASYKTNSGWQLVYLPKEQMILLNVPVASGETTVQYVLNTLTGAWTYFTGINSNSWVTFNENTYFSYKGQMNIAFDANDDNGNEIIAYCRTAFTSMKTATQKHVKLIRPLIVTSGKFYMTWQVECDFKTEPLRQFSEKFNDPTGGVAVGGDRWDISIWDEAVWGGSGLFEFSETFDQWLQCSSPRGVYISLRLGFSSNRSISWQATEIVLQAGGIV